MLDYSLHVYVCVQGCMCVCVWAGGWIGVCACAYLIPPLPSSKLFSFTSFCYDFIHSFPHLDLIVSSLFPSSSSSFSLCHNPSLSSVSSSISSSSVQISPFGSTAMSNFPASPTPPSPTSVGTPVFSSPSCKTHRIVQSNYGANLVRCIDLKDERYLNENVSLF